MTISEIKADIDFLCGSTSASYPDADKIRNINIAYNDVARVIWESDGDWHFDDANNTDSPIAYRTLANASASYLIPTNAIKVEQVEIKDADSNWRKLKPISYHELSVSPEEFLEGGGTPIYYQLEGTKITLYPTPSTSYVTMASGMLVRLARNVTEFPVSATSAVPGFVTPFHRILSLATAIDFEQDGKQREFLMLQKDRLQKGLSLFYAKRGAEYKTRVKPATKKNWRLYT